jgi:hypothetical protein
MKPDSTTTSCRSKADGREDDERKGALGTLGKGEGGHRWLSLLATTVKI